MKILLLSPPYLPEYMRNARCDYVGLSHTQWYPIWLGYCGALLEKHGYDAEIIDSPAYRFNHETTERKIIEMKPDMMVVYSSTKSESNDIEFAEKILDSVNCKVIFVGPYVSIDAEGILAKSDRIDAAVKGEFDYPVLELARGDDPQHIKNLIYRDDGIIKANPLRPLLTTEQLDELPFVTDFYRRHLDLRQYTVPSELLPFVDLFTGRGCGWGLCTFCLWVHSFIPGAVYNKRSIENVIEEIQFVKTEMKNVREVFIQDDTLMEDRALELSEAILKANLKIVWACYLRGNVSYDTLKLMKQSGCRTVHVGYESASTAVLKNVKKGLMPERMTQFTKDAKRAGLRVHADFVIGLNGETVEGIKATIEWAKQLDPDTAQFSILNPYPGTPFYEYLDKHGCMKDGEPSYPDLPNEELRMWAKRAYREFYFSWQYAKRVIRHPYEHLFGRLGSISKMIPSVLWRKW